MKHKTSLALTSVNYSLTDLLFSLAESLSYAMIALQHKIDTVLPDKYIEGLQLLQNGETRARAGLKDTIYRSVMKSFSPSLYEVSTFKAILFIYSFYSETMPEAQKSPIFALTDSLLIGKIREQLQEQLLFRSKKVL